MKKLEYTSIESIIQSNPRAVTVDMGEFKQNEGFNSKNSSYHDQGDTNRKYSWDEFEKEAFNQKQKGSFIVFPDNVLGMEKIYRVRSSLNLKEHKFQSVDGVSCYNGYNMPTRITFGTEFGYSIPDLDKDIILPDQNIMDDLQMTMSSNQLEKLNSFYKKMAEKGDCHVSDWGIRPGLNIFANNQKDGGHTILNSFDNKLAVYHNGVKIPSGYRFNVESGDVFRIGPSIVFGYIKKE